MFCYIRFSNKFKQLIELKKQINNLNLHGLLLNHLFLKTKGKYTNYVLCLIYEVSEDEEGKKKQEATIKKILDDQQFFTKLRHDDLHYLMHGINQRGSKLYPDMA